MIEFNLKILKKNFDKKFFYVCLIIKFLIVLILKINLLESKY